MGTDTTPCKLEAVVATDKEAVKLIKEGENDTWESDDVFGGARGRRFTYTLI